jgi:hypothetical protein
MSPMTRLPYVHGALNDANDLTQTGLSEPITGLELPSGCVLGQWADWTVAEALAYSNSTVGTLYAGRYQRVYLDPGATTLRQGQLLWWVQGGTYQHQVTNVEPADLSPLAGIYINPGTSGPGSVLPAASIVTPGQFFWMQAFGQGGVGSVLLRTVLTGIPSVGCSIYAAGAGAGTDNARADVLDGAGNPTFQQAAQMDSRLIGTALVLPVGNTIIKVSLAPGRMMVD